MRSWGVWVRCALAGALVLSSGANVRSAPDQAADPAAMEAAQAIIDREEAASGRRFDTAFRADVLKKLASKSLEQLAAIRTGLGGGVEPSFLGSNTQDFVYTPVTPCRIIDTRLVGGPISAGTYRNFYATGVNFSGQGGTSGDCGIPKGPAKAVVINFVALGTSSPGPGNLSVTPYPSGFPLSSIINWTAGVNIANGIPAAICNNYYYTCTYDISVAANNNTVQVVADVLGYFAPPFATSLNVQIVYGTYFLRMVLGQQQSRLWDPAGTHQRMELPGNEHPQHRTNYAYLRDVLPGTGTLTRGSR